MPKFPEDRGLARAGATIFALAIAFAVTGAITPAIAQVAQKDPPAAVTDSPAAAKDAPAVAPTTSGDVTGGNDAADSKGTGQSPFAAFDAAPNNGPVDIKSDSLFFDYKNSSAVFRGHVHAKRADGELTSDLLKVQYGKDFHELQQMTASGNVRMIRGTQWSASDHAVLDQTKHTVVLTGNPVVHDGNDEITGKKITVYLQSGQSVVDGGAKAVIFPRSAKTRDNVKTAEHAK